ncbi:MAG: hypothetical protein EZS28_023677 [Streblomastix strix]|uniref:Uncharacterized protein n=1 Tax=Streblomastix strix TaxID=222440 RepID=A0A5J4VE62_9EUKA|nr:MAG: hypothetical protein EZS28_023677 [Streblomastix strix]
MTPASDANPQADGTVTAGTSTEYSREDHVHPLNISTNTPNSDTASGSVGTSVNYARSDHSHLINISTSIALQDSTSGSVGTSNQYARSDHSHRVNVETNVSNIPIVNGIGNNGTSTLYARQDHIHPQQLTYDGNVTATKFIKTGGTTNEVLLADGSTKQSSIAGRSFTVIDPELYVKLCTILAVNSNTDNSIKFEVSTKTGFGQLYAFQGNITKILTTDGQTGLPDDCRVLEQVETPPIYGAIYSNIQLNPTSSAYDDGLRIGRPADNGLFAHQMRGFNRILQVQQYSCVRMYLHQIEAFKLVLMETHQRSMVGSFDDNRRF